MNFSLSKFSKLVDLWKLIWFPFFLVCKNSIWDSKISNLTSKITDKVKFEHLRKLSLWIVFALPFERIPSLNIGVNLRISQILTLISLLVIAILILKKNTQILKLKIQKPFIWLVLFYFFSVPSWFFVQDFGRFLTTSIATFLSFTACFLVAHWTISIWQSLKYLLISITLSGIFGFWQFFGDLLDFPIYLTGLRPQYTKAVFGYPRIQATAIEPLYFAGMLFLPLFFIILIILNKQSCREFLLQETDQTFSSLKVNFSKFKQKFQIPTLAAKKLTQNSAQKPEETTIHYSKNFTKAKAKANLENVEIKNQKSTQTQFLNLSNLISKINSQIHKFILSIFNNFDKLKLSRFDIFAWFSLVFFSFLFFFTLSKSGWLCFLLILFSLLLCYKNLLTWSFWQNLGKFALLLSFLLLLFNFNPNFSRVFFGTIEHFAETLRGESGTISERNNFLQAAFWTLPEFAILGIGSGQFGIFAKEILNAKDNTLIVNNVYVEIWLEHGFVSLICFLGFLISPFWQYFGNKFQDLPIKPQNQLILPTDKTINKIIGQTLCFTMLAFYLQWLTFSPIFINPIFITLGLFLAYNAENQKY